MEVYEAPYINLCNKLYDCGTAYQTLKQKGILHFDSTSFLRGMTFDDCIIIVDEIQNLSYQEIYTLLTRIGDNCRVFLCGDLLQDDLTSKRFNEESGYGRILPALKMIESCEVIEFGVEDIVRSGFVKEFIMVTTQQIQ